MDLSVVNHKDYFAKIGDDHKFPINKFGELAKYLIDKKIVTKFLDVDINFLGWLPESKSIAGSIVARKPAVLQKSLEPILQKNFTEIVNNLVEIEVVKSSGVKFFNNK